MKNLKKIIFKTMCLGLLVLILPLIFSCAFPFSEGENVKLSDISGQLRYNNISRQGFMGGSVFYNPAQPSSGQVVSGAHLAVRFGKVERRDVGAEQSVFTDKADEARYGYVTVNYVDKDRIEFTYVQYSFDGKQSSSSWYSLHINDKVDVNGDGLADLTYAKPIRKRPGLEDAIYLTFVSSQEDLNTSMFAVLPEQYSRGVYPSGIIGINIDGRFIVSKYEGTSATRSAVLGAMQGDFVLDASAGNYQRIKNKIISRNARSITDSELENIEFSSSIVSYEFTDFDFSYGYDAELLFSALPNTVKNLYLGNDTFLQKLNSVLKNRELIILVSQEKDTSITVDKFAEISEKIAALSEEEIVQINRLFLDMVYPDVCPQFTDNSAGIAEVLGLACVIIGGDNEQLEKYDNYTRAATKASSATDYDNKFNDLDSWYKGRYKDMYTKSLPTTFSGFPYMKLNKSFVKIGIYAAFTCIWGNIGGTIEGVAYLNADASIQSTNSYNIDLLNLTESISVPVFSYGPIVLSVGGELNEILNLKITSDFNANADTKARMAFAGVYGAGVSAGVQYGTTTQKVKVLFVTLKITVPYINGYSDKYSVEKAIYYTGLDSPTNLTYSKLSITLTPQISASVKADISKVLTGSITAQEGFPATVAAEYVNPYLTGTAVINETRRLYAGANIGVEVDLLITKVKFGLNKSWDLVSPYTRQLQSWQLFKVNLN